MASMAGDEVRPDLLLLTLDDDGSERSAAEIEEGAAPGAQEARHGGQPAARLE